MRLSRGQTALGTRARTPDSGDWQRAEILRDGGEIAIYRLRSMVHPSLEAAENLAKEGVEATVWSTLDFVKPRWMREAYCWHGAQADAC